METIFHGIFDSTTTTVIDLSSFMICIFTSFICGIILTAVYQIRSRSTASFLTTLAILPIVVCVVIMMVNGNIGTGVAIAGAFGLVRFRSAPGTAKEIGAIFTAMAIGLIAGMGYIAYAIIFTLTMCVVLMFYSVMDFGAHNKMYREKIYRITIPEDLDYTTVFDDTFHKFAKKYECIQVKTVNMGSMFRLTYVLTLKDAKFEKKLMDELRTKNGNLEISVSLQQSENAEL